MTRNEEPSLIAKRFGRSVEWATEHTVFPHKCVDGKRYLASCLVTDPDCDRVARSYLSLAGKQRITQRRGGGKL